MANTVDNAHLLARLRMALDEWGEKTVPGLTPVQEIYLRNIAGHGDPTRKNIASELQDVLNALKRGGVKIPEEVDYKLPTSLDTTVKPASDGSSWLHMSALDPDAPSSAPPIPPRPLSNTIPYASSPPPSQSAMVAGTSNNLPYENMRPVPVWIMGSEIPFGEGGTGGRGGAGGTGRGRARLTPEEKEEREKSKNFRDRMTAIGAVFGMDLSSYFFSGKNPMVLAAQMVNKKLSDVGKGLASDRIGDNVTGAGAGISLAGMATATPLVMVLGGLVEGFGKGVEALRTWNENLMKANFQFADFSAAMANVKAQQEIREIFLSRERGDRRAPWAARQAESASELEKTLAPWEDAVADIKAELADAVNRIVVDLVDSFEKSPIGQGLMKFLNVKKRPGQGEGVVGDWIEDIRHWGRGGWTDLHGLPPRWDPMQRPGRGGGGEDSL